MTDLSVVCQPVVPAKAGTQISSASSTGLRKKSAPLMDPRLPGDDEGGRWDDEEGRWDEEERRWDDEEGRRTSEARSGDGNSGRGPDKHGARV